MSSPAASSANEFTYTKTLQTPRDWEEPHPGIPIPVDGCQAAGGNHHGGGCRGDMAAKSYGPYHRGGRPGVPSRRYSRPRMRTTALRPLTIPANVPEEPESRSTTLALEGAIISDAPVLGPLSFEAPATSRTEVELDASNNSDGETVPRTSCDDMLMTDLEGTTSSGLPSPAFYLSDFSNHIGNALEVDQSDMSSLTVYDPEFYCQGAREEDPYGWDAELERKLQHGYHLKANGPVCTCERHEIPVRRGSGSKKTLFQRVFSLAHPSRGVIVTHSTPTTEQLD